jgi:hypothetical protein
MSEMTELEMDKILIDEAERIKENECRWKDEKPIVNVKDFEIKFMQLIGFEGDIAVDTDKKRFVEWVKRDDKSVKILPLIITSNIYLLAILATLSTMLSVLIKEGEKDIDDIGIDFLVGKGLTKYSDFIKKSFTENYNSIIPDFCGDNLTTVIEINFSELKSLLNILIVSLEIEGVNLRKIIKRVSHTDLEDYCRENVKRDRGIEQTIKEWISRRRGGLPDDEIGKRTQEVSLNKGYNITEELLKIVRSFLQHTKNESRDKFILIVATPVKDSIKWFFTEKMEELELDKGRLDDIMFVSYTDPTGPKDPKVIVESIPSYLTIVSKYLNSQEIVYAIDEYFHSKMMDATKSRKFQCEKFHEEIERIREVQSFKSLNDKLKKYCELKKSDLEILNNYLEKLDPDRCSASDLGGLRETLEKIRTDYVKKQKKELEVINDGFLTVQNDILEQLKLIL